MKTVKKILKISLIVLLALLVAGIVYVLIVAFSQKIDATKLDEKNRNYQIQIYDNTEKQIYSNNKSLQNFSDINKMTIDAFLAIEDKEFFSHNGINLKRIIGAFVNNVKSGKMSQGGSTITQQLIKNTHLTSEKTINRKIKEVKLSFELESKYTKEEIFVMYLNNIYFGNGIYGLSDASRYYFNKNTKDLSAPESAYLAALVKAPTHYSKDFEKAKKRKNLVIKEMRNDGKISQNQYDEFINSELSFTRNNNKLNPSVINYIVEQCKKEVNVNENIKIYTKIDSNLLDTCSQIYKDVKNAMINIIIDNTTSDIILAQTNTRLNLSTLKRQPASIIKPILPYSIALENNLISPSTIMKDKPCSFGEYSPKNYNNRYYGDITIRQALMYSSNIVAVKTLEYCNSIDDILQYANKFNIKLCQADNNLALALGGLTYGVSPFDIANAYSTFANEGFFEQSSIINKIADEKGRIIYKKHRQRQRIIRDDTAFLITNMLQSVAQAGTAKALSMLPFNIAAKTGTCGTDKGNTDAWTVAYTKNHTFLSWCGNPDSKPMPQDVTGGTIPCMATKKLISETYKDSSTPEFNIPPSIINIDNDYYSIYNIPKENTDKSSKFPKINVDRNNITIRFIAKKDKHYIIFREDKNKRRYFITQIFNQGGEITINDRIQKRGIYKYFIADEDIIHEAGSITIK